MLRKTVSMMSAFLKSEAAGGIVLMLVAVRDRLDEGLCGGVYPKPISFLAAIVVIIKPARTSRAVITVRRKNVDVPNGLPSKNSTMQTMNKIIDRI